LIFSNEFSYLICVNENGSIWTHNWMTLQCQEKYLEKTLIMKKDEFILDALFHTYKQSFLIIYGKNTQISVWMINPHY
jgi:hypothetical protein